MFNHYTEHVVSDITNLSEIFQHLYVSYSFSVEHFQEKFHRNNFSQMQNHSVQQKDVAIGAS